jgi:3-mercaptopyruvate sulfurtransferase SseA
MNGMPRKSGQEAQPYEAWEDTTKELIEHEMIRRGIRYKQLSSLLEELGINESPDQINRKVTRKKFSAAFFVACLLAMGVEKISIKDGRSRARREASRPTRPIRP